MFVNWMTVMAALLSVLAFRWVFERVSQWPARRRLAYLFPALVLALPGLSFAFYYLHLIPDHAWYFEFRSWPGTEILMVFVAVFVALVASFLPRWMMVFALLGVIGTSMIPTLKPLLGPIPDENFKEQWNGRVCTQSTPSTCGPSAAASALRTLGIEASERDLARESHSSSRGTEAWYLARAIRARGVRAKFSQGPGFDPSVPLPAIYGVQINDFGHFIAILEVDNGTYVVGDPLNGEERLSAEALLQRYEFSGFSLSVRK